MRKWLQDTYNGIYVVLLKPYMPGVKLVVTLIIGVLIGLAWAYVVSPLVFYDSDPRYLDQSYQDEWVKMLADRYAAAPDPAAVEGNIVNLLADVDDPTGIIERLQQENPNDTVLIERLSAIQPLAEQAEQQPDAAQAPNTNSILASIVPWIVAPLVAVIVFVIVALLYGMFIHPNLVEPIIKRMRGGEQTSAEVVQARQARAAQAKLMDQQKTDFKATDYGAPLMQRMSTYNPAFGTYDESYTIEDEQERFLGECGASVGETNAAGNPVAFEVWLFDKDDFVRTMTKVFVAESVMNDPAQRANLETRGDLVVAAPGKTLVLETSSLRLQARIVDMSYAPNGGFDKMTLELAAWRKDSDGAPAAVQQPMPAQQSAAPSVIPPQQNFAPPPQQQFAPPPPPPPSSVPGGSGSSAGSQPPPIPPDDDPFGGTGDFTPIR